MIFHSQLTWKEHIKQLVEHCNKDLNLLRLVSGTSFGADKSTSSPDFPRRDRLSQYPVISCRPTQTVPQPTLTQTARRPGQPPPIQLFSPTRPP